MNYIVEKTHELIDASSCCAEAKQAVKILEGKAEPKDMPIEYQENADLIINKDTVKTLGIKIPEKLKKEAKMVTTQKKTDKE